MLIVKKLTGFSSTPPPPPPPPRLQVARLRRRAFSALHAHVSWSSRICCCCPCTTACVWVCMLVLLSFFFLLRSIHVVVVFSHFLLMRVLCLFLALGSKFQLHMSPYSASPLFYFLNDQCPFLISTFVIQRLYLFADRKLKTWLYYVNVLVKLFPLHGVGWHV